jgi:hypothetical protein
MEETGCSNVLVPEYSFPAGRADGRAVGLWEENKLPSFVVVLLVRAKACLPTNPQTSKQVCKTLQGKLGLNQI